MTKKLILCLIFFLFAPLTLWLVFALNTNFNRANVLGDFVSFGYGDPLVYTSRQDDSKVIFPSIKGEDSTLLMIEKYLSHYRSPLSPYAQVLVETAWQFGVDPKLIVAIAQQESNLGKSSPENCYNAWGWGIYGNNVIRFDSWAEGIEKVGEGISKNYAQKGLDTPEKMAPVYTPPNSTNWRNGVRFFMNQMDEIALSI